MIDIQCGPKVYAQANFFMKWKICTKNFEIFTVTKLLGYKLMFWILKQLIIRKIMTKNQNCVVVKVYAQKRDICVSQGTKVL